MLVRPDSFVPGNIGLIEAVERAEREAKMANKRCGYCVFWDECGTKADSVCGSFEPDPNAPTDDDFEPLEGKYDSLEGSGR